MAGPGSTDPDGRPDVRPSAVPPSVGLHGRLCPGSGDFEAYSVGVSSSLLHFRRVSDVFYVSVIDWKSQGRFYGYVLRQLR